MKRKVPKAMVRAAMLFGSDTLRKRREAELLDGIRKESIRGTAVGVACSWRQRQRGPD